MGVDANFLSSLLYVLIGVHFEADPRELNRLFYLLSLGLSGTTDI